MKRKKIEEFKKDENKVFQGFTIQSKEIIEPISYFVEKNEDEKDKKLLPKVKIEGEDTYPFEEKNTRKRHRESRGEHSEEDHLDKNERKSKSIHDEDDRELKKKKTNLDILVQTMKKNQEEREQNKIRKRKELEEELEKLKETEGRKEYWLHPDIVVKIINKDLYDGKFFGEKARVLELVDHFIAVVVTLDTNKKIKFDQCHLETVLPAKGSKILIVNGAYRGQTGKLIDVKIEQFKALVAVDNKVLEKEYEDVCKIYDPPLFQVLNIKQAPETKNLNGMYMEIN